MLNEIIIFKKNKVDDFYLFGNQDLETLIFTEKVELGFKSFNYCPKLNTIIFLKEAIIKNPAFTNCVGLEKVIFAYEYDYENSINFAFDNTPFKRKITTQEEYNNFIINNIS